MHRGFKLSGTMAMSFSAPQSVGVVQIPPTEPIQRPPKANLANLPNHDIERALPRPIKEMESFGLKKRGQGTKNADENTESSADSSPTTLTPSSSRDDGDSQGTQFSSRARKIVLIC